MQLLDVLADSDGGLGVTDLGELTDLNASTVHRLVSTLQEHGYVRQDPQSKKYLLGTQSLRLGYAALAHFDIRDESLALLRHLAETVHESANLAILTGAEATYVAQVPAARPVHMFTQLGSRVPLHCTGVGKAILAHLPQEKAYDLLDGSILAYTENTITNTEDLAIELASVRRRGFAIDNEEREVGVRCISAPIFRADGSVLGAVSISGPSARLSPVRDQEFSQHVMSAAKDISYKLGFRGILPGPSS